MTRSPEPIQLRCFDSFAPVRADAAGRLDDDARASPFDRLDWFERLHESAFPGKPLILQAWQGSATAWLFLAECDNAPISGIANWYSFAFRPQFHGTASRAQRIALLAAIGRDLRDRASHARFHPIVDDDEVDAALIIAAFRQAGWRATPRIMAMKRLLRLAPGTRFENYWADRPGKLRSTLKRKAQRHPLDIAIHRDMDDARWAALEEVFGASWKPEGDDFRFLRAFAEAEAQAGRLRLGIARIGNDPAAVELWTVENDTAYIHKLAFAERFADASPGTQLSHAMFRHAIDEDGATLIDFGTGDNDYKAQWMPQTVPMRQIDVFDLRRPASWRAALATSFSALTQPEKSGGGRRAALKTEDRTKI